MAAAKVQGRPVRWVGAALAVLALLVGGMAMTADPALADCATPQLWLSTEEVRAGHIVDVTGVGFALNCPDTIENGKKDATRPAKDIVIAVQQGELDFGVTVVDAGPGASFNLGVYVPTDFVVGEATITATIPPQAERTQPQTVSTTLTITDQQPTIRVAGSDRITTAVAISRRAFPGAAATVYLARADMPIDAMVGGVLQDGPILLVPRCDDLPAVVAEEIERLRAGVVASLGGAAAVCDSVMEQAAAI